MAKSAIDLLLDITMSPVLFGKFVEETKTIDQLKELFGKEYEWPGDKEAQKILDARQNIMDSVDVQWKDDRTKY